MRSRSFRSRQGVAGMESQGSKGGWILLLSVIDCDGSPVTEIICGWFLSYDCTSGHLKEPMVPVTPE